MKTAYKADGSTVITGKPQSPEDKAQAQAQAQAQGEEPKAEWTPEAYDIEYHQKSGVLVFKLDTSHKGGRAKSGKSTTWNVKGKLGGISYTINAYRPDASAITGEANVKVFDD